MTDRKHQKMRGNLQSWWGSATLHVRDIIGKTTNRPDMRVQATYIRQGDRLDTQYSLASYT